MEQEKLERKVIEIFEEQGFEVDKEGNRLTAEKAGKKDIQVFSSEKYSKEQVKKKVEKDSLIFVDEDLKEVQESVENNVSIIEEEEDRDYELPSYELIGDIAVINELNDIAEEKAVEGIRYHHPHVETILLKEDALQGEYRVGNYRKLFGEKTETVHKEFGCRFKVDPTKVYFSERFGTERNRVVSQIEEGEDILVMFAGVGPFAVLAAKNAKPQEVVAVEKNPEAVEYLRENIELNNVAGKVQALEGDVSDVVPELGDFDRILMPLPGNADEFLPLAMKHARKSAVIHYYRFVEDQNWEEVLGEIEEAAEKTGKEYEISEKTVCGNKGPGTERACIDIRVK